MQVFRRDDEVGQCCIRGLERQLFFGDIAKHPTWWLMTLNDGLQDAVHAEII